MRFAIRFWTPERDAVLRERFVTGNTRQLAEDLGCTVAAVRCRAIKIGLNKVPDKNWRPEEVATLRANYLTHTAKQLAELIPTRSIHGINIKLIKEGLCKQLQLPWRASDDARMRREYPTCASARELAKSLGRSYHATLVRARAMGLRREEKSRLASLKLSRQPKIVAPAPAPKVVAPKPDYRTTRKTPQGKKPTMQRAAKEPAKKWYHYPMNSAEYRAGVAALHQGKQRVDIIDDYGRVATVYRNAA